MLLLELPGASKFTIARALAQHAEKAGETVAIVDNHLTSLPVLEAVGGSGVVELLKGLARELFCPYVSEILECDEAELRRRVVRTDRAARREWVDSNADARFVREETWARPSGDVVDIDGSAFSPAEVAADIFGRLTFETTAPC